MLCRQLYSYRAPGQQPWCSCPALTATGSGWQGDEAGASAGPGMATVTSKVLMYSQFSELAWVCVFLDPCNCSAFITIC